MKVEREGEHIADLGPGDFFGEQGLLEKQARSATVIATSPVRLIKIEHWELAADASQAMPEVVDRAAQEGRGALQLTPRGVDVAHCQLAEHASRFETYSAIDCAATYGRWSREVRCETGAVPPL